MTHAAAFDAVTILIPGYSIEDIPTDLNEQSASSLLNAFSVAWHPALLANISGIPSWRQAESTELPTGRNIVLVPECSEDWLGHDWRQQFSDSQSTVLAGCSTRADWLKLVAENPDCRSELVNCPLVDDFLALGTAHLQLMLLSRRMHHFMDPDQYLLESEVHAAVVAVLDGRLDEAHDCLRRCFECLLDTREQIYAVECFLIDLCLPADTSTPTEVLNALDAGSPVNLLSSVGEIRKWAAQLPDLRTFLAEALDSNRIGLMSGHENELRPGLSTLSATYSDILAGMDWLRNNVRMKSFHWARRRFGMVNSLPGLLSHFGFSSAFHVALDDGIYPDRERAQMLWEGPDASRLPAVSRIPLAIDSASSFLRFADRMTESMQEDNCAGLSLAHLPTLQTPWLTDLRTATSYAPVFGQLVTINDFIEMTTTQAAACQFEAGEYLSPHLIQSSVLQTESPVTNPAQFYLERNRLEQVATLDALSRILKPATKNSAIDAIQDLESQINAAEAMLLSAMTEEERVPCQELRRSVHDCLESVMQTAAETLRTSLTAAASQGRGVLVINPLPFTRNSTVRWPGEFGSFANPESCRDVVIEDGQFLCDVQLPPGGFVWISEDESGSAVEPTVPTKGKSLAEPFLLRNQFFELTLNEVTGGIAEVRFHNQRANRVSQQVAYRYETSKTHLVDDEEVSTAYATTRLVSSRVLKSGPWTGSVETSNEIADVVTGDLLATFRQTTTVERNRPRVSIRIDFDQMESVAKGNPWMTYYGSRFAWDNESAAVTRGVLSQSAGFRGERFESPDYVEIADADHRLLIVPHGRPYHRRSGRRMLDSLLIVDGEQQRSFEFTLEFDQPFPMRTVNDLMQPPVVLKTTGIPSGATAGWLIRSSAKNVSVARIRSEPVKESGDAETNDGTVRLVLLLAETEGQNVHCQIDTARPPRLARLRRPDGTLVEELTVTPNGISVAMSRFQMKEVELTF